MITRRRGHGRSLCARRAGQLHPAAGRVTVEWQRRLDATCERARLLDAREEGNGSEGRPERGGAPASRGGGRAKGWTVFAMPTGWTVFQIPSTPGRLPSVRCNKCGRDWAAGRWPRWFGGLGEAAARPRRRPAWWCDPGHTCSSKRHTGIRQGDALCRRCRKVRDCVVVLLLHAALHQGGRDKEERRRQDMAGPRRRPSQPQLRRAA